MRPMPPCTPDCSRRSPTCHGSCPDYAAYAEKCGRLRDLRLRESEVTGLLLEGAKKVKKEILRKSKK